ncbi:MAG: HD domain-containing protein [Parcubacteria group bacterium]|nr:HD domain-containing protein [Parcubacteria group bacterium]
MQQTVIHIPAEVRQILSALTEAEFSAHLVGGCVRDLLCGIVPKDWDVATSAAPEDIQRIFPDSFYENDFGTVGVKTGAREPALAVVEVTPYRVETTYSDKRHPDKVTFTDSLERDLARRDFTINAMAISLNSKHEAQNSKQIQNPKIPNSKRLEFRNSNLDIVSDFGFRISDFNIVDPFGGREDLQKGIIRAVGKAEERFGEDALRLMRAARFAAELGFAIEAKTKTAIKKHAGLLEMVARERVRDEFLRMLESAHPDTGLELLRELGLLRFVAPELEEGVGVSQNLHHIYTVWEHNIRAMQYAAEQKWPIAVRMASLLHDVGKPRAKRGKGRDSTFYGHEVVGAKMTAQILSRLRFSKEFTERITKLVRFHLFYYNVDEVTESSVRRLIREVGPEDMDALIQVRMADRIGSGVPKAEPYKLRHFRFMVEKLQRDPISVGMLKIDGNDIMQTTGLAPGPKVGQLLNILLDEVLDDPKRNTKAKLTARTKELAPLSEAELAKLARAAKHKALGLEEEAVAQIKKKHYVK